MPKNAKIICEGSLMENMDKRLPVTKWVLINGRKYPKCPNLSAKIVTQAQNSDEKRLHWAPVVRVHNGFMAKVKYFHFSRVCTFLITF